MTNNNNYKSCLSLIDTQIAIKLVKDTFEEKLQEALNLIRVSAPLFVKPETGLNDNLSGYEQAVSFKAKALGGNAMLFQNIIFPLSMAYILT